MAQILVSNSSQVLGHDIRIEKVLEDTIKMSSGVGSLHISSRALLCLCCSYILVSKLLLSMLQDASTHQYFCHKITTMVLWPACHACTACLTYDPFLICGHTFPWPQALYVDDLVTARYLHVPSSGYGQDAVRMQPAAALPAAAPSAAAGARARFSSPPPSEHPFAHPAGQQRAAGMAPPGPSPPPHVSFAPSQRLFASKYPTQPAAPAQYLSHSQDDAAVHQNVRPVSVPARAPGSPNQRQHLFHPPPPPMPSPALQPEGFGSTFLPTQRLCRGQDLAAEITHRAHVHRQGETWSPPRLIAPIVLPPRRAISPPPYAYDPPEALAAAAALARASRPQAASPQRLAPRQRASTPPRRSASPPPFALDPANTGPAPRMQRPAQPLGTAGWAVQDMPAAGVRSTSPERWKGPFGLGSPYGGWATGAGMPHQAPSSTAAPAVLVAGLPRQQQHFAAEPQHQNGVVYGQAAPAPPPPRPASILVHAGMGYSPQPPHQPQGPQVPPVWPAAPQPGQQYAPQYPPQYPPPYAKSTISSHFQPPAVHDPAVYGEPPNPGYAQYPTQATAAAPFGYPPPQYGEPARPPTGTATMLPSPGYMLQPPPGYMLVPMAGTTNAMAQQMAQAQWSQGKPEGGPGAKAGARHGGQKKGKLQQQPQDEDDEAPPSVRKVI